MAQQPAAVADQLRPLAEAGDERAIVLYAWAMLQAGRWPESLEYGRQALELGAVQVGAGYIGNMIGQPEHAAASLDMLPMALDGGWQVDPLGWIVQFAQRGDSESVARLLQVTTTHGPRQPRADLDQLIVDLGSARETFGRELSEVQAAKAEAVASIAADQQAIAEQRRRLEDLGQKVERLSHEAASDELAKQYATHAKHGERIAFYLSLVALVVGGGAAVVAAYLTIKHANESDPKVLEGLAKASISLPIALFAAALGKLGARYRRMAWHWRHVELQLRTAEPYIAELEGDRRANMIEALAGRFFPGQPLSIDGERVQTGLSNAD